LSIIVSIPVRPLSQDSFGPFGVVLQKPEAIPEVHGPTYAWWDDIGRVESGGDPVEFGWLTVFRRPLRFDRMERHRRSTQMFIPMQRGPLVFCVAPPSDPADGSLPDATLIQAFWLDGTQAVQINPGVWHLTMFPLDGRADLILVHRTRTSHDDAEWGDLAREDIVCVLDLQALSAGFGG
jgi:ureidoglycolate lyase